MEDEAKKRKERLSALKSKVTEDSSVDNSGPVLRFRNYEPKNPDLKPSEEEVVLQEDIKVEDAANEIIEESKAKIEELESRNKEELDLENLAPKKPNWDLKRDVEKKLDKLERRTQKAIAEIIRRRLIEGKDQTKLAEVVAAQREERS